jgi:hypothetical protein
MIKKKISLIILLLLLMSAPATRGWIPSAPDIPAERTKSFRPIVFNRKSIVLAENDSQASKNESQSINENRDQAPDTGVADREKSGNISKDAESKPLKPFKPSEEIAAEQAVDFPVDI